VALRELSQLASLMADVEANDEFRARLEVVKKLTDGWRKGLHVAVTVLEPTQTHDADTLHDAIGSDLADFQDLPDDIDSTPSDTKDLTVDMLQFVVSTSNSALPESYASIDEIDISSIAAEHSYADQCQNISGSAPTNTQQTSHDADTLNPIMTSAPGMHYILLRCASNFVNEYPTRYNNLVSFDSQNFNSLFQKNWLLLSADQIV